MRQLTDQEKQAIFELEEYEVWIKSAKIEAEVKAKMYVAIAHDWLFLQYPERAYQNFINAASVCKGYFYKAMYDEALKDKAFASTAVKIAMMLINLEIKSGTDSH